MNCNEIEKVLGKHKFPVVAFSGGKDSTAVLNLVRSIDPSVTAVFCNTGVETKETIKYVKRVDNVVTLKPDRTFWDCVEQYGLPQIKGKNSSNRVNHCCYYLKDKPMRIYIKENNIDLIFTGLTIDESRQRMMFLKSWGEYGFVKTWNVFKCHPISEWLPIDVWNYIDNYKLDYNKAYDPPRNAKRCGCEPCTAYCSWKEQLARENLKLYCFIQHKMLGQQLIEDYV